MSARPNDIMSMVSTKEGAQKLLAAQGREAQKIIDQLAKNIHSVDDSTRKRVIYVVGRMCRKHTLLPVHSKLNRPIKLLSTRASFGGHFADVWEGITDNQKVAVKRPKVYGDTKVDKLRQAVYKEIAIWSCLDHPHVLKFIGVSESAFDGDKIPSFVSPWMENKHVAVYLDTKRTANRVKLLDEIAGGLAYLHLYGIVHGDLKSVNILVDEQEKACLADFGITSIIAEAGLPQTTSYHVQGTPRWMAPEIANGSTRCSLESDIFALGLVAWELFSGALPFPTLVDRAAITSVVAAGDRPSRPDGASEWGLSDEIWNLMEKCWDEDPKTRPSIDEIVPCTSHARTKFRPGTAYPVVQTTKLDTDSLENAGLWN